MNIKVYTGYDKIQAVDELSRFLNGNTSMYPALVRPIIRGKISKDIQVKVIAAQIKQNMLKEADANGGKIKVTGKSKYYPVGNWSIKHGRKGEPYEVLTLDLWGEDSDIFTNGYMEKRIGNFISMANEVNLLHSLQRLGIDARGSNNYEDKIKKVDIVITNRKGQKMGVSVYRSTDTGALTKLTLKNKNDFTKRFAYNIYKYGKPSDVNNVKRWIYDCRKGKNLIVFNNDGTKYVTE